MKNPILLAVLITLLAAIKSVGQTPVDVADNTFKVKSFGEEIFYYGFAEGDQLIFSFQEVDNKELKEVEIIEMPGSSKFMDYKSKKVENKTVHITKEGIYKFRFANGNIAGRICKVKIQRVPASPATANFNTNVLWRSVFDTTYTTEQERYLVKSDTTVSNFFTDNPHVHSQSSLSGGNSTFSKFTLPDNTVAWGFYLGVGQEGQQALADATSELAKSAGPLVSKIPGYGPLGALALNGSSYLVKAQGKESINYAVVDIDNEILWAGGQNYNAIARGQSTNAFSRVTNATKGDFYVCLTNTNIITAVDVTIKVTAIVVNNQWGERPVAKMHVAQRQEAYLSK
jgi:hypothetical protein